MDGRSHSLGYFDTEQEAALAYNNAALKFFGEFARLNIVGIAGAIENEPEVDPALFLAIEADISKGD